MQSLCSNSLDSVSLQQFSFFAAPNLQNRSANELHDKFDMLMASHKLTKFDAGDFSRDRKARR